MQKRVFISAIALAAAAVTSAAQAQETCKIGMSLPMTGPFASTGK